MPYFKQFILFSILSVLSVFSAESADNNVSSSRLAMGRWVKIAVDTTGVYRVSYDTLREWGFSNPSRVAVYGYGSVEQDMRLNTSPDDLPALACRHIGQALYFYGEGDVRVSLSGNLNDASGVTVNRNYYSNGSRYFLYETEQTPEMRRVPPVTSDGSEPLVTHTSVAYYEPEEYNPNEAGVFWYSRPAAPGGSLNAAFDLHGITGNACMGYKAVGLTETSFVPRITSSENVTVTTVSNTRLPSDADVLDEYNNMTSWATVRFNMPRGGDNVAEFAVSIPDGSEADNFCLDAMWVRFIRENSFSLARNGSMTMHFPGITAETQVAVRDMPYDITVWNVTDPRSVYELELRYDGADHVIFTPGAGNEKLVAFSPSDATIPSPRYIGEAPNSDLHAMPSADYVIITSREMIPACERLAAAHADIQGLEVAVVDKEHIFNEFASGNFTANAIRRFVKMLHERDGRLKYVMLMGGAYFDNRLVSESPEGYLPVYEVEREYNARSVAKCFANDCYFGMLDDDLPADISTRASASRAHTISVAIGRTPALTAGDAEMMVDKYIAYLRNPALAGNFTRGLFMADRGDANQHMHGAEKNVQIFLSKLPGATALRAYDELFPATNKVNMPLREYIRRSVSTRPFSIIYTGHSRDEALFSESFYNASFNSSIGYGSMPLTFLSTCLVNPFDQSYRGIAHFILVDRNHGSIGVMAPSREVYLTANHIIADIYTEELYGGHHKTVGDLIRTTLNRALESATFYRTNSLVYNFMGDPAIPMPINTRLASVTAVGGASPSGTVTIEPGVPVRLTGVVTDEDGIADSGFNGTVTLDLYDAAETRKTLVNVPADAEDRLDLELSETLVASVSGRVENGRWEVDLTVPALSRTGLGNRLSIYATADDSRLVATGALDNLSVSDAKHVSADTEAPVMLLSIDNITPGAEVAGDVNVRVKVSDAGSGIAFDHSSVGRTLTLSVDNHLCDGAADMLRPLGDGSYELDYPLENLVHGRHTVTASVCDNAGNHTVRSIDFVVVVPSISGTLTVDNTIVRTEALFDLETSAPSADVRLVIEDMHGNAVRNITSATFPCAWDLTADDGTPVEDGRYRARAVMKSHPRYGSTPHVEFTVIR